MTDKPVVIFMTSNGVGMGHLSRQLTIAISGADHFDAVLFSLSGALPRIMVADRAGDLPEARSAGVRYEHCPSRESGWLPAHGWQRTVRSHYQSYRWHPYLRDRLIALAVETQASAVVFDGVVPYAGLLQARAALPDVRFVWVRRGMWQPEAVTKHLRHGASFDLILEPGDFGAAADQGPLARREDAESIAPVSLCDVLAPTSRNDARAALGLPTDRPVMLLAPGSGALGSVDATAARIVAEVARRGSEWVMAVTRQSIARHRIGADGDLGPGSIVALDDVYPLARHLHAFDAAVGAAGYNSVHELLVSRVPTVLVPSVHHATDDQGARAHGVAARGAALVADGDRPEDSLVELLNDQVRAQLADACADLEAATGGQAAAHLIGPLATQGFPAQKKRAFVHPPRPWLDARTPIPVSPGGDGDRLLSENIVTADIRGSRPVEHLIDGHSAHYRAARAAAASWLYRPRRQVETD